LLQDGSRLDRLRRASPKLSHEQVYLAPEIGDDTRRSMRQKLTEALQKESVQLKIDKNNA
jgi:hypothetical protein